MMIDRVVSQVRVRHLETALPFYEAGLGGGTGCLFTKTFMLVLRLASRKFI